MFWLFLSEVCVKGTGFLTSLYLARILGVAGFGLFTLVLAVNVYLSLIADMGIGSYGVREVARNREQAPALLRIMNSMRLVIAVATVVVLAIILVLLNVSRETMLALLVGGSYVIVSSLSVDWIIQGLERMEYIALTNLIVAAVYLFAIFVFVKTPEQVVDAIVYRMGSLLIGTGVAVFLLKRKLGMPISFAISHREWWPHAKESFYFAMNSAIVNIALYLPLFVLSARTTLEQTGLFSAAQKLILFVISSQAVMMAAVYPMHSNLFLSDRARFEKLHRSFERLLLYLGVPLCIMGTLFRAEIVQSLFGDAYAGSAPVFSVLVWLVPLMFLRTNVGRSLASAGFHRFNMVATGSGLCVSVVCYLLLVPLKGALGASIAAVTGEIATLVAMLTIFRRNVYRYNPFDLFFLKVFIIAIIAGLVGLSTGTHVVIRLLIGSALYVTLSIVIGLITFEEIKRTIKKLLHVDPARPEDAPTN